MMKFGGTSVGSASMIKEAAAIVMGKASQSPIVVVSAVSKATDEQEFAGLEKALEEIAAHGKAEQKDLDSIAAFGEIMAAKIFAEYGRKQGMKTKAYGAFDIGMLTDDKFGAAEILEETFAGIAGKIRDMPEGEIPVVTGFIGKTKKGEMTTLGRGGSDYSASVIGAAINADEVQIWTDVDGMMTADPKVVPNAHTIGELCFDEASELAYFGAKVLHPKTILPVMRKGIPVRVLNTYRPSAKGTRIVSALSGDSKGSITAIACKKGLTVINMHSTRMFGAYGFLHKIFKMFDEHHVPVDMVSTSEVNVSVTIDNRENGDVAGLL
ncbi:aspartate kinase, partial [Candidatus Woesearchaeota archaeon]|nr:aspartate kinase [Candidatus Woesearchaeota archaeon]